MSLGRWSLLEIGARHHPEFRAIADWLEACPAFQQREWLPKWPAELTADSDIEHPDLLVVWQCYSDEFSTAQWHALLARFPLSRAVCIASAWCAADGRTRGPALARFRVAVDQARHRLELELQSLKGTAVPACSWTAAVDEVWRWTVSHQPLVDLTGKRIALDLPDMALRNCLVTELETAGVRCLDSPEPGADAILIDIEPWTEETMARVEQWSQICPNAELVGVTGWVTPDLVALWNQHGIHRWLNKSAPETWRSQILSPRDFPPSVR
ncbi:hypothetical protein GC163_05555 [bacterium]|nr:hypothetical protein [bacterium]